MANDRVTGGQLRFLSKVEVERVHTATLNVLEKVGLRVASEVIMNVFRKGGGSIKDGKVCIPPRVVNDCLKKAPKKVGLCGRNPAYDIVLEDSRVYFGMGGTPTPLIRDLTNGEFRRPTKKDFAEATKLGDALPSMSFVMALAGAFDVPYEVEYEHEWEVLFNNTEKPIVYSAPSAYSARKALEMGAAVAGGMTELRKRPIMCLYSEAASPLTIVNGNENIIEFAKAGIPIVLEQVPLLGASGPGTIPGSLVVSNAENLALITLSQLLNAGTPIIYGAAADLIDPLTGRDAYAAPESVLSTSVLNAQMAEYYGLPTFGVAGASDSKLPDAQAGAEAMMQALMNALAGINLIHDCGYLASGSAGSMEMAVICDEILGNVQRILRRTEVNDETLAIEVIKEVGPEGNFLGHKHTLKHIRNEIHMPRLFDRTAETTWTKAGRKATHDVAREKAKRILKDHTPQPLPNDVQVKLSDIVRKAEREQTSVAQRL